MGIVFVYVTCKNRKEAAEIAGHLLNKKLIACANFFPIESMFLWKGKKKKGREFTLIAKTIAKNFSKAKQEIMKIHSYEVPCITKIPVKPNKGYAEWILREIGN